MDITEPASQGELVILGDVIDMRPLAKELPPVSKQTRQFLDVAGDSFTSFDAVVRQSSLLLQESTTYPTETCYVLAEGIFSEEDYDTGPDDKSRVAAEQPWIRAAAMCDLACSAVFWPNTNLDISQAAAMLRATLEAAAGVCSDAELALYYLDEFIEGTINQYEGQVRQAAWSGDTRNHEEAQGALARLYEILDLAGLAKPRVSG